MTLLFGEEPVSYLRMTYHDWQDKQTAEMKHFLDLMYAMEPYWRESLST